MCLAFNVASRAPRTIAADPIAMSKSSMIAPVLGIEAQLPEPVHPNNPCFGGVGLARAAAPVGSGRNTTKVIQGHPGVTCLLVGVLGHL
jgi:hypothetical protein